MADKKAIFKYLDELRKDDNICMLFAEPYIEKEFGVGPKEARAVLYSWLTSFETRDRNHEVNY